MVCVGLGVNAQGTYGVKNGAAAVTSGTTVTSVPNITMTWGVTGGADFSAASNNETFKDLLGATGVCGGNGVNGTATSGTVYYFEPKFGGTLSVGIVLNASKSFFVQTIVGDQATNVSSISVVNSKGASIALENGGKVDTKLSDGLVTFAVEANKKYAVFCTGSKLGFFGFKYECEVVTGNPPTISTQPSAGNYIVGETAQALSLVATPYNDGELSYQWYSNTTNSKENATRIEGATSASYTPSVGKTGTTYYFCEVTESGNDDKATTIVVPVTVKSPVCEVPTFTIGNYDYENEGYSIVPSCSTEGAVLTYTVGGGDAISCSNGTTFYAKGGELIVTASKEGWTSSSSGKVTLSAAPSSESPESLLSFNKSSDTYDKDQIHNYVSVSVPATYIAGIYSNSTGLKLRCNRSININGENITAFSLDVNEGYKVTSVKFTNLKANRAGVITVPDMFIDGIAATEFVEFEIPANSETAIEKEFNNLNATSQIAWKLEAGTYDDKGTEKTVDQFNVLIEVTYEPYQAPTSATIETSTELSTYVTTMPLDFAGVDGLTAYVVSEVTATSAKLEQASAVPANTPVILEGKGSFTVPVAESASEITDNELKAGSATMTEGDFILKDGKFVPAVSGSTLPVGKAYINVPAGARSINLVFGETTGISETITVETSEAIYNLSGVRVKQAQKGLYIQNGKKIVK